MLLLPLLAACTDYGVSRSELSDEVESAEITLTDGATGEVVLRLEASAEALAARPNNWVDVTVFALRKELTPVVSVAAGSDAAEVQVVSIEYIDVVVDNPLRNCDDPEAGGPEATVAADGTCVVLVPVSLAVVDGAVSLQVTAHYELSFGIQSPPGEMSMRIVE